MVIEANAKAKSSGAPVGAWRGLVYAAPLGLGLAYVACRTVNMLFLRNSYDAPRDEQNFLRWLVYTYKAPVQLGDDVWDSQLQRRVQKCCLGWVKKVKVINRGKQRAIRGQLS